MNAHAEPTCGLPGGNISVEDLPEGSSAVDCDAIGRTVVNEHGLGIVIPEPGVTVTLSLMPPDDSSDEAADTTSADIVPINLNSRSRFPTKAQFPTLQSPRPAKSLQKPRTCQSPPRSVNAKIPPMSYLVSKSMGPMSGI